MTGALILINSICGLDQGKHWGSLLVDRKDAMFGTAFQNCFFMFFFSNCAVLWVGKGLVSTIEFGLTMIGFDWYKADPTGLNVLEVWKLT